VQKAAWAEPTMKIRAVVGPYGDSVGRICCLSSRCFAGLWFSCGAARGWLAVGGLWL
jgi:hypothetical protein